MLEATKVSHEIDGKSILSPVSFSLNEEGKALVLGSSGSGKTTLLAILAGLLKPAKGEVRYGTKSLYLRSHAEIDKFRGQKLGIIFQNYHLIKPLTVMQNVTLGLGFTNKALDEARLQQTLERLNLSQKAHQKASLLSMGEAQRVAVARAVIGAPEWILCDEPTSALDDANAKATLELLEEEASACGAGLVIVTHDSRVKSHFSKEQILSLGEAS